MYLVDPVARNIGVAIEKIQLRFDLTRHDIDTEYYDSKQHGFQLITKNEHVDTMFFFIGKSLATSNEVRPRPWSTKSGLGQSTSQNEAREMYGMPIKSSRELKEGMPGNFIGWWDLFHAPWGTMHVTYGSDLSSVALITCMSGESIT